MLFQRTPLLEDLVTFLTLLSLLALPRFVFLAITKMICECHFIFEVALAIAAPELCRGRWRHRRERGVRLHV
jgi:hypothetical protein